MVIHVNILFKSLLDKQLNKNEIMGAIKKKSNINYQMMKFEFIILIFWIHRNPDKDFRDIWKFFKNMCVYNRTP